MKISEWWGHHDSDPVGVVASICRFNGCDDDATATVGTVALCALHGSYIEDLMDQGQHESSPIVVTDRQPD